MRFPPSLSSCALRKTFFQIRSSKTSRHLHVPATEASRRWISARPRVPKDVLIKIPASFISLPQTLLQKKNACCYRWSWTVQDFVSSPAHWLACCSKKHSWRSRRRRRTTTTTTTTTTTREEITSTAATKRKADQTIAMMKTEFFSEWEFLKLRAAAAVAGLLLILLLLLLLRSELCFFIFLWVLASSPIADLHWAWTKRRRRDRVYCPKYAPGTKPASKKVQIEGNPVVALGRYKTRLPK